MGHSDSTPQWQTVETWLSCRAFCHLPIHPIISSPVLQCLQTIYLPNNCLLCFRGKKQKNKMKTAFHFLFLVLCTNLFTVVTSLSEVCRSTPLLPTMPHLGPNCSTSLPSLAPWVFTQGSETSLFLKVKQWKPWVPLSCFPIAPLFDECILCECPCPFPWLFALTGPLNSRFHDALCWWHCLLCLTLLPKRP